VAAGDAHRIWFPEMVEHLRLHWRDDLSMEALLDGDYPRGHRTDARGIAGEHKGRQVHKVGSQPPATTEPRNRPRLERHTLIGGTDSLAPATICIWRFVLTDSPSRCANTIDTFFV
jgi:hypothetical protein